MRLIFLIILSLQLFSCDLSSPEEASKANLTSALDKLQLAFDLHNIDDIMVYYASDYMHNGDDRDDVQLDWEIRLNDYQEMTLENITIDLSGSRATISFNRRFYNNGLMVHVLVDPDDNGDMSYWELKNSEWQISGNELDYGK
ncbi:MAG: hypothetical protein K9N06_02770 [Candidatus Cloacimonetes bacterium]|nr:hypothetical protein [Candidatus Cloacimonadota bacterium]